MTFNDSCYNGFEMLAKQIQLIDWMLGLSSIIVDWFANTSTYEWYSKNNFTDNWRCKENLERSLNIQLPANITKAKVNSGTY